MRAAEVCTEVGATLVERGDVHGDAVTNHANIAALWGLYLGRPIDPVDVATMMILLKIARSMSGRINRDDYIDACGYAAIAAELVERDR